jgi:hypothetical protein
LGGAAVYALRDIVHDWPDDDVVATLASLRAVLRPGGNATCVVGADGATEVVPVPAGHASGADRVVLIDRLIRPGASFVHTFGSNDADIVMLAAFGTTAGERTRAHFEALACRARLRLEAVWPTRSHYFALELAAAPPGSPCADAPLPPARG